MAKTIARARSVKTPKGKSGGALRKNDKPVRLVAEKRASSGKDAAREAEKLELLRDVHQAEKELAAGKGVAHSKARSQVLARLRR
jgi:hypothetical protein